MIASVYIKDGNIHFYNEAESQANIGGLAYVLGIPLLNFICYAPDLFDESFSMMASAFDNEFAHVEIRKPEYMSAWSMMITELQQDNVYMSIYTQMFMEFLITFIDSPRRAIERLSEKIPIAEDVFFWAWNFEWPDAPKTTYTQAFLPDKEKRLFRAAKDAVAIISEDFREKQASMVRDIKLLLKIRRELVSPQVSSLEYLYALEEMRLEEDGIGFYLKKPVRSFYGTIKPPEIVLLYEIDKIDDLFRFEFIKMIEHDIFIKKCKNCGRFFIPKGRSDVEYCNRIYGDGNKKCSEIGAMLRYEKKVAGNPILEAHKKAYRRFHSRTRTKKMSQAEFMKWSDEASKKRDACLAEELPFEEFVAWLEQGRVRKSRNSSSKGLAE